MFMGRGILAVELVKETLTQKFFYNSPNYVCFSEDFISLELSRSMSLATGTTDIIEYSDSL